MFQRLKAVFDLNTREQNPNVVQIPKREAANRHVLVLRRRNLRRSETTFDVFVRPPKIERKAL